ncbi:7499_t:CDS:1, partial [Acaulospora colombiana]
PSLQCSALSNWDATEPWNVPLSILASHPYQPTDEAYATSAGPVSLSPLFTDTSLAQTSTAFIQGSGYAQQFEEPLFGDLTFSSAMPTASIVPPSSTLAVPATTTSNNATSTNTNTTRNVSTNEFVVAPKPVRLVNPAIHLAALVEEGDATSILDVTQDSTLINISSSSTLSEEDGGEDGENDADDEADDEDKTVCSPSLNSADSSEWTVEKVWQGMYEEQEDAKALVQPEVPSNELAPLFDASLFGQDFVQYSPPSSYPSQT